MTQRKILDEMLLFGNSYAYRRYIKNRPITSWISHIAETIIWRDPVSSNGLQDGFTCPNSSSFSDGWKNRVDFTPGIRHLSYLQIRSMMSSYGTDGLPIGDPSERSDKSLGVVRALEVPDESGSRRSSTTRPSVESGPRSLPALPGPGDDSKPLNVPSGPEDSSQPLLVLPEADDDSQLQSYDARRQESTISQKWRPGTSKWMRRIRRWFDRITRPRNNIRYNPTTSSAPRSTGSQGETTPTNPIDTLLPARTPDQGDPRGTLSVALASADGFSDNAGETTTNFAGENTETKAAEENTVDAADKRSPDADVRSIETRATARTDFVLAEPPAVWCNNLPGYGNLFVSLRVKNAAENSPDAGVGGSDKTAAESRRDVSVERPKTSRGSLPPYGLRHGNQFLDNRTRGIENTADGPDWAESSASENFADTGVGATESIAAEEVTNSSGRGIERSPAEYIIDVPIERLVLSQTPNFKRLSRFVEYADASVEVTEKSAAEEATYAAAGVIERNAAEDPAKTPIRRLVLPQTPRFGGFAESIALSGFSFVADIETRLTETTTTTEDTSVEAETAADEIITKLMDESGTNEISDAIAITTPGEEQFNETSPTGPSGKFHSPTPHNATASRSATPANNIEARIENNAGSVGERAVDNVDANANESATSSAHEHRNDQISVTGCQNTASRFHEQADTNEGRSSGSDANIITSTTHIGNEYHKNAPSVPARDQLERYRRVWARQDKRPFSLAWMSKK
jgi:hypothetical protein